MTQFIWSEREYGVGIALMDAHHRELFAMLRDLYAAMAAGQGREAAAVVVTRLADYTKFHFTEEEALLARHEYPELPAQQQAHAEFNAQLARMQHPDFIAQERPALALLMFLQDWLANHIAVQDRAYTAYLAARGVH